MEMSTWRILKKLQTIYSIAIIRDDRDERIFVVDSYTPFQNNIPNTIITGREITYIIKDNSLAVSLTDNLGTSLNEKQMLITKIDELPSMTYRFSPQYRYEIWEII